MATRLNNEHALIVGSSENMKTPETVSGEFISQDGNVTGTFKEAADVSDIVVFNAPRGQIDDPKNVIYAHGYKFGGGVSIDSENNSFTVSGVNYTLGVNNETGELQITQFIPLTGVSKVTGSTANAISWELDSGEHTNITWTGSYAPTNATPTIEMSWSAITSANEVVNSNSGNTIKFTTIPNNAVIKYRLTGTQTNGSTKTKDVTTSYWTRKYALFISPLNLSVSETNGTTGSLKVTGVTSGGFKLNINNTEYGTASTGGYVAGGNSSAFSSVTSAHTLNQVTSGYVYIICSETAASFTKYITKNGSKGLAKETFTKVSTNAIKTYEGGAQTLYLFRSNGQQADVNTIAFSD